MIRAAAWVRPEVFHNPKLTIRKEHSLYYTRYSEENINEYNAKTAANGWYWLAAKNTINSPNVPRDLLSSSREPQTSACVMSAEELGHTSALEKS